MHKNTEKLIVRLAVLGQLEKQHSFQFKGKVERHDFLKSTIFKTFHLEMPKYFVFYQFNIKLCSSLVSCCTTGAAG